MLTDITTSGGLNSNHAGIPSGSHTVFASE